MPTCSELLCILLRSVKCLVRSGEQRSHEPMVWGRSFLLCVPHRIVDGLFCLFVSLVATNMTDGVVATFQKQCAVVPGDTNGWILSGKPARDSCDKAGTSSKEEGNRGRLAVADRALETGKGAVAVMEAAKIHGMEATGADSHSPPANVQESSQSSMLCTCMYDPPPTKTPPPYCTKRIASSPRFLARLQLSVSSVKGGAGWEVPWTQVRSSGPELHAVVVMDGERRGVH